MIRVSENWYQLRGPLVQHYALLPDSREEGIILIDGGFVGSSPESWLRRFAEMGFTPDRVEAILLTHGHIDHTLNLSRWQDLTGAAVYAPAPDRTHVAGTHQYEGVSKICGVLEAVARRVFQYQAPENVRWFDPGEEFPFAGGLKSIPLPGHTSGHCGFYSERRNILFSGDLYSCFRRNPKFPPPWFNSEPRILLDSLRRAVSLDLSGGVLPNHCHRGTAEQYRDELFDLARRVAR